MKSSSKGRQGRIGQGINALKITVIESNVSIFKVGTKLRIFPPLIAKYL